MQNENLTKIDCKQKLQKSAHAKIANYFKTFETTSALLDCIGPKITTRKRKRDF